jgi:hypothetical protein
MDRYDDGWVGRFCEEVDVLLGTKVVLLKKSFFPTRIFLAKKKKVLIRGKGLTMM